MTTRPITRDGAPQIPAIQRVVSILWPSFLVAAVATVLFFTLYDPLDLARLRNIKEPDRLAGYTLGFFGFWLLAAISSALTCYFRRPCHRPADRNSRTQEGTDLEQS